MGSIIGPGAVFMQAVARGWLIYEMTDSAFLLGLTTACMGLPFIFIAPFAGVIADRVDKRNMIIISESVIMFSGTNLIQVWHIIASTLCLGIGMAFALPSRQSIIAELLDREHLMNGIALYSMGSNIMRILGPIVAGILVAIIDIGGVFLVSSLMFIFAVYSMLRIGPREVIKRTEKTHPLHDLIEGGRYIGAHKEILVLILVAYMIAILGTNYITLLPIFVKDIFHLEADGLGFMMGAAGVGALISALMVAATGTIKHKGTFLLMACLVYGAGLIAFSFTGISGVATVILLVIGGAQAMCLVMNQTILQSNVERHILGRVLSVYLIASGLQNFSGLPFGAVAEFMGAPLTITLCGALLAAMAIALLLAAPRLRAL